MGVIIPSAYRRVEYLESTGTEYIDSGIECTSDLAVEFSFMCTSSVNAAFCGGIYTGNGSTYFRHHCSPDSADLRYWIQNNSSTSASVRYNGKWATNTQYKVSIDPANGTAVFNNQPTTFTALQSGLTTGKSYGIFARITDTGDIQSRPSRIYYFRFYKNNQKIGDFVPCVRISDSTSGMYDTVSGTFYTNSGTGEFVVGPDVIATEVSEWLMTRRRGLMVARERLGPNLLNPIGSDGWFVRNVGGRATFADGKVTFEATGNTGWSLYITMKNRSHTYIDLLGKKLRATVVVDSITLNSGNVGLSGSPDFTGDVSPATTNARTAFMPNSSWGGPPLEPGVYTGDFICNISNFTTVTSSFSESDYLGFSLFLNATTGANAVVSDIRIQEIL